MMQEAKATKKRMVYTKEEDKIIEKFYAETNSFKGIEKILKGRTAKGVREHYLSYMKGKRTFTAEEEQLMLEKYQEFGNKWGLYELYFPGATRLNIRDRVKYLLKSKISCQCSAIPIVPMSAPKNDEDNATPEEQVFKEEDTELFGFDNFEDVVDF